MIEIVRSFKHFIHQLVLCNVDAILHLRGKLVPQLNGELAICGAEGANESIFEGLDHSLHGVNPVVVGLD
jgi:hypothetical protein